MKTGFHKKSILLILSLALLLSAAGCTSSRKQQIIEEATQTAAPSVQATAAVEETQQVDSVFTMAYDPDYDFNPISGSNSYNMAVASLVYETLFTIDDKYEPQPLLCESFTTGDGLTFIMSIRQGVTFHDGTEMTAEDVAYSIAQAQNSDKYSARLKNISSVEATGDYTVTLTLSGPDFLFMSRMDIPVIQSGTIDEAIPAGTGPYVLSDSLTLTAYSGYRDASSLPLDTIYLTKSDESSLNESIENGAVDLTPFDPTGLSRVNLQTDCEQHYYNTPILQYVGFNMSNDVLSIPEIRRAFSLAIDRDEIVNAAMNGHAAAASVLISPNAYFYDSSFASGTGYSKEKTASILSGASMKDTDGDGYLNYQGTAVSFSFIVNSENPYKVRAAEHVADALKAAGINVTLKTLSWDEYNAALTSGDYDMYYGEVRLTADFDPTELLTSGGTLNFGGVSDENYASYISSYLGAQNDAERKTSAAQLCQYIFNQSHIIPILYKQNSVVTQRGAVTGLAPNMTSPTSGITGWSVNLKQNSGS